MSNKGRKRRRIVALIEDLIRAVLGVAIVAGVLILASLLLKACGVVP